MAMLKSFFPLTAFIRDDKRFADIWELIRDEYELTKEYIFKLSGHDELMADYPVDQLSIQMRERIVLPLLTIQQYSLARIRNLESEGEGNGLKAIYEKLIMRCSFGIINAGRNSA
jgi:phosphoenolpyruvate carboxylase